MRWSKEKRRIRVCVQHPTLTNSFLRAQSPTGSQCLILYPHSDRTPDPPRSLHSLDREQSDWSQCRRQLPFLGIWEEAKQD